MPDRLTKEDLEKSHHGLCGVSIGDGPCSCLVHWVEALQAENDKLKDAIRKVVVFNVADVRRPMLAYDEEAVRTIWGILGFPVAHKR